MLKKAATSQRLTGYNKLLGAFLLTLATVATLVSIALAVYLGVRLASVGDSAPYEPNKPTGTSVGMCTFPDGSPPIEMTWDACQLAGGDFPAG